MSRDACRCGLAACRWPLCQPEEVQQRLAALIHGQLHSGAPPFRCIHCGAPSWVDPSDQRTPVDYCHPGDHGDEQS